MLYAFFLIRNETSVLLYEKVFIQEINDNNLDIFKSFITALKQLISQMKFDGSKELKSISLGDYHVKLSHLSEINSELIMVVDKKNDKSTNKLVGQFLEIIIKYKELFNGSQQNSEVFEEFDQTINSLILSSKNFNEDASFRDKNMFKSIWNQKGEISSKLRENLIKEKEILTSKLNSEKNILVKSILFKKLIVILEKLNNKEQLNKVQDEYDEILYEINDRRMKLTYYLNKAKESMRIKDYKDAYMNLYSFSTKLKNLAKPNVQKKYYNLANKLTKKESIPKIEFSRLISEILMLPESIDEYLP